jgi:hypothetical protein
MKKKLFILAVLLFIFVDVTWCQCSMCKKIAGDANANEEFDTSVGRQLNNGILYLMTIPYIILFILFRKKIISFLKELRSAGAR